MHEKFKNYKQPKTTFGFVSSSPWSHRPIYIESYVLNEYIYIIYVMCIKKNNRVLECECMPPAVHIAHIESGYATVECPAHKLLYNAYHF